MRLAFERFEELSGPYYRVLFKGKPVEELETAIAKLDTRLSSTPFLVEGEFTLADIAHVPWTSEQQVGLASTSTKARTCIGGWVDSPSVPRSPLN